MFILMLNKGALPSRPATPGYTSFSLALMAVGSDPCQNLLQNRLITTALEYL